MGGQRLPLAADRGEPEGEGLAEPYPPARRSQSSAVRAPEVGEHDALEGARPCRARIRPAAELDGRQDCAHHWHRAGEVQDWHDEPVSSDDLHRRTAPLFMRPDQAFVWGIDLKRALKAINGLCFPKIISERNGGAAQTKLGWRQRRRSCPCPAIWSA